MLQQLARALAVDGHVLVAVGNPDVGDAGRAQGPADRLADLAAGDAVLDPEAADAGSRWASVKPSAALGWAKKVGLKSMPMPSSLAQSIQRLEMGRLDLVPLDRPAAGLQVDGVQVEAVLAGDQAIGRLGVGAEFVGRAGLAGIVAGGQHAAAGKSAGCSNPPTSSPCQQCMEMGMRPKACEGRIGVNAQLGVTFFCQRIGSFQDGGFHGTKNSSYGGMEQKIPRTA